MKHTQKLSVMLKRKIFLSVFIQSYKSCKMPKLLIICYKKQREILKDSANVVFECQSRMSPTIKIYPLGKKCNIDNWNLSSVGYFDVCELSMVCYHCEPEGFVK